MKWLTTATRLLSARQGRKASLKTRADMARSLAGSRPSPARTRITASAVERSTRDQPGSSRPTPRTMGRLASRAPASSMPGGDKNMNTTYNHNHTK